MGQGWQRGVQRRGPVVPSERRRVPWSAWLPWVLRVGCRGRFWPLALAGALAAFQAAGGDVFQRVASGVGGGVFEYLQGIAGVQVLISEQGLKHALEVECRVVGSVHVGVRA